MRMFYKGVFAAPREGADRETDFGKQISHKSRSTFYKSVFAAPQEGADRETD